MPILDNGEPLRTSHCPKCGSMALSYWRNSNEPMKCKNCDWIGRKSELIVKVKPE